jgi:hypothetical protein
VREDGEASDVAEPNLLYYGNNLDVLTRHAKDEDSHQHNDKPA